MSPVHSVVLANYNGGPFLREAIGSVLAQERVSFELVLVDDGSTDGSLEVMRDVERHHPGTVRVFDHSVNRGQGAGFNTGMGAVRGNIVSFIDADDAWFPGKLRHVEEAFAESPDAVLHHHNLDLLHGDIPTVERVVDMMALGDIGARWLLTKCGPNDLPRFAPTSGLSLPKRVVDLILPCPEVRVCADMWLTFAPLAFGPVSACYRSFGAYRVHAGNHYFGRDLPIWDLLYAEFVPAIRELCMKHGVKDVIPPLPATPGPPSAKRAPRATRSIDPLLDLSLRKVLRRLRGF